MWLIIDQFQKFVTFEKNAKNEICLCIFYFSHSGTHNLGYPRSEIQRKVSEFWLNGPNLQLQSNICLFWEKRCRAAMKNAFKNITPPLHTIMTKFSEKCWNITHTGG